MKKLRVLFGAYCLVMLWLLFGQRMGTGFTEDYADALRQRLNLMPFDTIGRFLWVLQHSHQRGLMLHAVINLAGNVVMFVPLGLLLPQLWKSMRKPWAFFGVVTVVLVLVEAVQLVTLLGSCDIDDLILNLVGAAAGYAAWFLWGRIEKNKTK